ncbi:MAG: iron-containing alcohol dehydrogenase [Clostridia bacterium]|nr:iron-containing alcohol dehydrogenase [Clostridia bacterium]
MENFNFHSPTFFAFGKDKQKEVVKYIRQFGGTKVLLHYGSGSIKKSGLYDEITASLQEGSIPFCELGGVQANPKSGLVYTGIELCRKEGVDFILAVGGGSVIDSAKCIAAGVLYEGDFLDFFAGKYIEKALPIGTVLTIAAAGSEGSYNTVITNENTNVKKGATGEAIRPKFSILNPELTKTLPKYQIACGISDIMAHILERYFTNTPNVEITDRLCEAVLLNMINEGPKAFSNPADYDAQANIMWAGMVAHNNICGVGRKQDWSSHALAHELSARYGATHGAALAAVFPAWMRYNIKHDTARFVQFATRVWGLEINFTEPESTALEGIECYENFLKEIGMSLSIKDFGVVESDIPELAAKFKLGESKTIGSFVPLKTGDIEAIYKLAFK